MTLSYSESFITFPQRLYLGHDCKVFVRYGHLAWPGDLTLHAQDLNFHKVAKKMGDKVGENPAALRAAVFLLSVKTRRGGCSNTPPPPPAGRRLIKPSHAWSSVIRRGSGAATLSLYCSHFVICRLHSSPHWPYILNRSLILRQNNTSRDLLASPPPRDDAAIVMRCERGAMAIQENGHSLYAPSSLSKVRWNSDGADA